MRDQVAGTYFESIVRGDCTWYGGHLVCWSILGMRVCVLLYVLVSSVIGAGSVV